jgi:hypothetical protein
MKNEKGFFISSPAQCETLLGNVIIIVIVDVTQNVRTSGSGICLD